MTGIILKNKLAREKMRNAGQLLASIMDGNSLSDVVKAGISTLEIDTFIEHKMRESGLKPACKGYAGYKHATCISVNDVIVHGVPSKKIILKTGDFVKIDVVGSYRGYCADMARSFFIGEVSPNVKKMAQVAQQALDHAIAMVRPGAYLSDVSYAVQEIVKKANFGIVRDFAGHGIGKEIHEEPDVPNFGSPGNGPILQEGMTFAIEPMITEGSYAVKIMEDGWTAKTTDGGFAAHVEDTVLVTKDGVEILTRVSKSEELTNS